MCSNGPSNVTMLIEFIPLISTIVAFLIGLGAAVVYIRSAIVKQAHTEWKNLADARGEVNDDLREQLVQVRREVDELRGQVTAMQALKVTEIADEVVARLNG